MPVELTWHADQIKIAFDSFLASPALSAAAGAAAAGCWALAIVGARTDRQVAVTNEMGNGLIAAQPRRVATLQESQQQLFVGRSATAPPRLPICCDCDLKPLSLFQICVSRRTKVTKTTKKPFPEETS
jgi:hypothetical protein